MSFLDFPGLQYFYNKYLKPIKPHAREETIKSYTVNEQGHVPDAQLVVQLKEENESLQEEIEKLNSALEYSTGSITQGTPSWENIEGTIFEKNGCHLHIHGIIKSTTQSNIIILNGIESMNIANNIGIILPYGTSSKEYIGNYYAKVSQNSNSILLTLPKDVEANTYIGMDFVLELL